MSTLLCHPDTWDELRKAVEDEPVLGIRVQTSKIVPRWRWEFPVERFVAYDPADEVWCRYFGVGREDESDPWFAVMEIPQLSWDPMEWDPLANLPNPNPSIVYGPALQFPKPPKIVWPS